MPLHQTYIAVVLAVCGPAMASLGSTGDDSADAVLGQSDFVSNMANAPGGTPTASNLAMSNAAHLALSSSGRLYISDPDNNRVLSWPDAASFANGASADMVFGQPDFTSDAPNNGGVSAGSFYLPQGVTVDEGGHLWATDAFNSRVLKFNDPTTDATPTLADLVIGQPDFVSNQQNLGNGEHGTDVALPDGLQFPGRVIVRGADVYIADSGNSRVLHYDYPTTNKPFADRVFGQYGDFTRRAKNNDGFGNNGTSASADNLYNPIGLALDGEGRLYVADWANHRILRFDDPLGSTTPIAVYGQPDFVGSAFDNGGPAQGLQLPIDLALDAGGNLYVADSGNNRILVYRSPLTNNLPGIVFGQLGSLTAQDPNHGLGFFTADVEGLFGPTGVALDDSRNVYIADTNNNRALRLDDPLRLPGDLDCDGDVDFVDGELLATALTDFTAYQAAAPGCDPANSDVNSDGMTNGLDVAAFVDLVLGL